MGVTDWPIAVRTVDLAKPLRPIEDVDGYPKTRIFVFDAGTLIGGVDVANARAPISVTRLRDAIAGGVTYGMMRRWVERQLGSAAERARFDRSVPLSIVIPTCGRPDDLRRCLTAAPALEHRLPDQVSARRLAAGISAAEVARPA